MPQKVALIFDIGKTNKKYFLFNETLSQLQSEYIQVAELADDDGFACDDLAAIENWMLAVYEKVKADKRYEIVFINFSAYGATLVHLNEAGKPCTPLYNYLKPFPEDTAQLFQQKYGDFSNWSRQTASPFLGMLNAGLQLFWLKYNKPGLFKNINKTVFLPQYLSYRLTGVLHTEFTGIGCHTGMWDFDHKDYHKWMYDENFVQLLPPFVKQHELSMQAGTAICIGLGIHDSSAALLPYINNNNEPFILLSTGTWSICLNPFNNAPLTVAELAQDCLCFMQPDGKPVKASRLFLGNEYNRWVTKLAQHFRVKESYHKKVVFDITLFRKAERIKSPLFYWENINHPNNEFTKIAALDLSRFDSFEEAYHQLIKELVDLQVEKIHLVVSDKKLKKIYVDGGFADNSLFVNMLMENLPDFDIVPSQMPLGSATGAALMVATQHIQ